MPFIQWLALPFKSCLAFHSMTCLALPCMATQLVAMHCLALPCLVLCPALPCIALPCLVVFVASVQHNLCNVYVSVVSLLSVVCCVVLTHSQHTQDLIWNERPTAHTLSHACASDQIMNDLWMFFIPEVVPQNCAKERAKPWPYILQLLPAAPPPPQPSSDALPAPICRSACVRAPWWCASSGRQIGPCWRQDTQIKKDPEMNTWMTKCMHHVHSFSILP